MSVADFDTKAADCFRASPLGFRDEAPRELRNLVDTLETSDDVRSLVGVLSRRS